MKSDFRHRFLYSPQHENEGFLKRCRSDMSSLPFPLLFSEDSPLPAYLPSDFRLVNLGKQCTLEDRFQQVLQRIKWVTHKIKDRPHFLSVLHFNCSSNLSAQSFPLTAVKSRSFWAIIQLSNRLQYEGNCFLSFFFIGNISNTTQKKIWEKTNDQIVSISFYISLYVLKGPFGLKWPMRKTCEYKDVCLSGKKRRRKKKKKKKSALLNWHSLNTERMYFTWDQETNQDPQQIFNPLIHLCKQQLNDLYVMKQKQLNVRVGLFIKSSKLADMIKNRRQSEVKSIRYSVQSMAIKLTNEENKVEGKCRHITQKQNRKGSGHQAWLNWFKCMEQMKLNR